MQHRTIHAETVRASGAVSKCRAVGFDGAQAATKGQKVLGVADADAAAGDLLTINVKGTAVVETGAAVSRGAGLAVDTKGRAVPAAPLEVKAGSTAVTSAAANGAVLEGGEPPEHVFADALADADGEGRFIEVLLK